MRQKSNTVRYCLLSVHVICQSETSCIHDQTVTANSILKTRRKKGFSNQLLTDTEGQNKKFSGKQNFLYTQSTGKLFITQNQQKNGK